MYDNVVASNCARALNFSLEIFRGMTENGAVISSFIENLHSKMPVILSDVYLQILEVTTALSWTSTLARVSRVE